MKNERGYFTIYPANVAGPEEHATTARAALNKAIKMAETYGRAFIIVDRGKGKTTSKVVYFGIVEAGKGEYGITYYFTRDGEAEKRVWDDDTKAFYLPFTPRRHAKMWVDSQHVGMSDDELTEQLKAVIEQAPNPEGFTPEIIAETLEYALLCHKRNQRLFYAVNRGKF